MIRNQAKILLGSYRHALLCAVVFALTPYTLWLSLSVVALVTLRRGWRDGGLVLLPVCGAHVMWSLMSMGSAMALLNTTCTFVPCYLAACALRYTASWRAVAGFFLMGMLVVALLLQVFMPDFIMTQFEYIRSAMRELQVNSTLLAYINDKNSLNRLLLANYLFGIQMVGVVTSAILSLMTARSIQSQLYYPGGFKQEMLAFRANKLALLLFVVVFVAANQQNVLAMNLLPALVFYFLFAGLSFGFQLLSKRKMVSSLVLLVVPIVFLPFVMLPVYVILGSLDSLINFRLYLPSDAGKTT